MTAPTIYLAGASAEVEMIAKYEAQLVRAGWRSVSEWIPEVQHFRASGFSDRNLDDGYALAAASANLRAVAGCGALWLLIPERTSYGAWIEYGYAIACCHHKPGCPRVFVSGDTLRSIYTRQTFHTLGTHEEMVADLTSPVMMQACEHQAEMDPVDITQMKLRPR